MDIKTHPLIDGWFERHPWIGDWCIKHRRGLYVALALLIIATIVVYTLLAMRKYGIN